MISFSAVKFVNKLSPQNKESLKFILVMMNYLRSGTVKDKSLSQGIILYVKKVKMMVIWSKLQQ